MATIIVTGGCGFIGSELVRRLLGIGHRVINLDLLTYAGNLENLTGIVEGKYYRFVHGDISDRALVTTLLAEEHAEVVINVASETHVDRSIDCPTAFVRNNIVGVFELLEAIRSSTMVSSEIRFIQVSTDEVYGSVISRKSVEGDPYTPNSPYAASKAAADHLVRAYHITYGLHTVVTNGANTYGPRQFPEKLIPLHILNAVEGRPLPIYGNGLNERDWLFVDDHANGIICAMEAGAPGEQYHLGGTTQLANHDLVARLCTVMDKQRPRPEGGSYSALIEFVDDRPGHDLRYALDSGKALQELDWIPRIALDDGLSKTVRWYLENRDWVTGIDKKHYNRGRQGLGNYSSSARK